MCMNEIIVSLRGLVHNAFTNGNGCGQAPELFDCVISRGLPASFIYIGGVAGQDPGRAEIIFLMSNVKRMP